MNAALTKLAVRALLLVGVLALALAAAYLRGESPGITFAANGVELTISSSASYNGLSVPFSTWALKNLVPTADKFFNFSDIKPGDRGEATIGMKIGREPAWLCIDFLNLQSRENGVIEPETLEDLNGATSGELAQGMEFFGWRDDGDNVFEVGELPLFGTGAQSASTVLNGKTYTIADSTTGSPVASNGTRSIGIAWCAGDLGVNLATGGISCDGSALGNKAQTDSFLVDVALRAQSSRDRPPFVCAGGGGGENPRGERPPRPERPVRPEPTSRPERPTR